MLRSNVTVLINFECNIIPWEEYRLKEDFAEFTKCISCNQSLLYCDCNCPYCGRREECQCELRPIVH